MAQFTHLSREHQENILGHPYCLWVGVLIKHKSFICKLCLSVGVCPWLFLHSKKAIQLCCLLCLIFKIIFYFWYLRIFQTKYFPSSILLGNFHIYLSHTVCNWLIEDFFHHCLFWTFIFYQMYLTGTIYCISVNVPDLASWLCDVTKVADDVMKTDS